MVYGRKYHTTTMIGLQQIIWIGPAGCTGRAWKRYCVVPSRVTSQATITWKIPLPKTGGFVSYLEPFAQRFEVKLNHRLVGLDPTQKVLRFDNGKRVGYDK